MLFNKIKQLFKRKYKNIQLTEKDSLNKANQQAKDLIQSLPRELINRNDSGFNNWGFVFGPDMPTLNKVIIKEEILKFAKENKLTIVDGDYYFPNSDIKYGTFIELKWRE